MIERVQMTLNPNQVVAPAQEAARLAAHVVAECLSSMSGRELAEPMPASAALGFRFPGPNLTSEDRRASYHNWLLAKAFQDLARGLRASLEEAFLFLAFFNRAERVMTCGELEKEILDVKTEAGRLLFPQLLARVNEGLTEPLAFDAEFRSIQDVRNCLEHRGGVVGARDIAKDGNLSLTFPRLRCFYKRGEEEIDLRPGVRIEGQGQVPIFGQRVSYRKSYRAGERVTFSADEFFEIAFACHLFADDLGRKLPRRDPPPAGP
ncbi:hypothetical protein [Methylocystis echinoides]|uniref:hypothetical protein n=1 Tax=Methylocystis echinoides TaxID=29468 RepID=UPI0034294C9D